MGDSMVKTTVAFDRSKYEELKRIASTRRCNVEDLIRESVEVRFSLFSDDERKKAVEAMASLALPVGSWEEIEQEIISGATES